MFAPPLRKTLTRAAENSIARSRLQRSTWLTRPCPEKAHDVSLHFSNAPTFSGAQTSRSGESPPSVQLRSRRAIQAKLVIAAVDDPLEQEADRIAAQVMRMPDPAVRVGAGAAWAGSERTDPGNEAGKTLQLKEVDGTRAPPGEAPSTVHDVLRMPGQPLDPTTRAFFEPRFGFDFSKVRVHTNQQSAKSARLLGARAYTCGRDVVFGTDECATGSTSGRLLLAHELAHVVQQSARHGPAQMQRKEVATNAEIQSDRDWTTADREGESTRWSAACETNLNAVDSAQYVRVVERRDFYKWFYHYASRKGFATRWALAAYVVANGAHQIVDMDEDHAFANSAFTMANVELEGAMREGNQIIFDNVLPKLQKLIAGGPLQGRAALAWDSQVLVEEQALVQPLYKMMSPETIKQMEYIARKKFIAAVGAYVTGGDKVSRDEYTKADTVPPFDEKKNLPSVGDRWQYGMELGNRFARVGTDFDPAHDKMPAVAANYTDGSEFARVDTRKHLHELDAWLNPSRLDRVGAGSDYKAIIASLTEPEKALVARDRSPDGWAYSISFAQFSFIDETTVRAALPSDPLFAALVAAFLARYNAERTRVMARYPLSVPMPM